MTKTLLVKSRFALETPCLLNEQMFDRFTLQLPGEEMLNQRRALNLGNTAYPGRVIRTKSRPNKSHYITA